MNKTVSIIIISVLIVIGIVIFSRSPKGGSQNNTIVQNSEIRDGIQYVTINAKGGYSPRESVAKAGIPTKLIIKTNGTYDCSASLVIKSLNYKKILPRSGEEVIDLGIPALNSSLQGVCSMGMYNFLINFSMI